MIPFSYSARSLVARWSTSLATAGGLALVVFVLSAVLMLGRSIRSTLGRAATPDVVIIMRRGSDSEVSSSVLRYIVSNILEKPGIAHRPDGNPDGVGEVYVIMNVKKRGTHEDTRVATRGIDDHSVELRKTMHIIEGRAPTPGTDEALIGAGIRGRFENIELGQTFELQPNRPITVVGVFADGGSAYEAEVWADGDVVASAFHRDAVFSAVRARLESADKFDTFRREVESDPQLPALSVQREADFYEQQSEATSKMIVGLGLVTALLFSVGAMVGAMITMHASIAQRQREIGTLRALGFRRTDILVSMLLEAVLLAAAGGAVGAIAALALTQVRFAMSTMTDINVHIFSFETSPGILGGSMVVAAIMGVLGGAFPAIRAAMMSPIESMRAA